MKKFVLSLLLSALIGSFAAAQSDSLRWYRHLTPHTCGVDYDGAARLLAAHGSRPKSIVKVAIIDGGMDYNHPYFSYLMWINPSEKPDNGRDDDHNGFVDDVHGWNFLGSKDGKNDILRVGTAEYREYKRLRPRYNGADTALLTPAQRTEYAHWKAMERKAGMASYLRYAEYLHLQTRMYDTCDSLMRLCYGDRPTTVTDFLNIQVADTTGLSNTLNGMAMMMLTKRPTDSWQAVIREQHEKTEQARSRVASLDDPAADAHNVDGYRADDFRHLSGFGNNHVFVNKEDAFHATMVAGLVAEASHVGGAAMQIIGLRAVPDGDEYDRDIAAAVRYAVRAGAKVINGSFGKSFSDNPDAVNRALRYAARHDVLVVLASGNNGHNLDLTTSYPTALTRKGRRLENVLCVGASDVDGQITSFSNYSATRVDLLAPGSEIYSSAPGGHYMSADGTSVAAPIVSGIAVMLRSYFPQLSARQTANLLRQTLMPIPPAKADAEPTAQKITRPATGLANAARALQAAYDLTGK